jgi:hypothetical protein
MFVFSILYWVNVHANCRKTAFSKLDTTNSRAENAVCSMSAGAHGLSGRRAVFCRTLLPLLVPCCSGQIERAASRSNRTVARASTNAFEQRSFQMVIFQVLTAASTEVTVYWDIALYSLVETGRRFGLPDCLHHEGYHRSQMNVLRKDVYVTLKYL